MAGSKSGGATIELQQQSYKNLNRQLDKIRKEVPENGLKMIVKLLFDIKYLAQVKLKSDRHIVTSRLRNSIYVKMFKRELANRNDNTDNYSDNQGKTYKSEFEVQLNENEGAVGTNVEYASGIEFGYAAHVITAKNAKSLGTVKTGFFGKKVNHPGFAGDSFLYWALKNVDVNRRARELGKEILNGVK